MSLLVFLLLVPVGMALYAYAIYPLLLRVVGNDSPTPVSGEQLPMVSIVIPAYNEERQIAGAIEALIAQDYPADRRQILILSDASSDRTDEIVRGFASHGVELLRMPQRSGKTAAENASTALLRGTIVVNTDASIRFHPSAVRHLVEPMRDPSVGVVSGRDVSVSAVAAVNRTEAGYVDYEMWVRGLETRAGGIVGASGSGYAIRSELHRIPVRADLSRDFSSALTAHRHGYRAVSADDALCTVPRTASLRREYRRKVRTIARGMDTLYYNRDLLDVTKHGLFALKLLSHKVCRWAVPLTVIPAAIAILVLAAQNWVALAAATLGVVGIALTAIAFRWPEDRAMPKAIAAPAFTLAANMAVVHAFYRFWIGHEDHIWEPTRR
jgi:cellulose synthase/poly-beta-1,6-N-acetylglucosamine synthase-like glycosyltransferase